MIGSKCLGSPCWGGAAGRYDGADGTYGDGGTNGGGGICDWLEGGSAGRCDAWSELTSRFGKAAPATAATVCTTVSWWEGVCPVPWPAGSGMGADAGVGAGAAAAIASAGAGLAGVDACVAAGFDVAAGAGVAAGVDAGVGAGVGAAVGFGAGAGVDARREAIAGAGSEAAFAGDAGDFSICFGER